MTHERQPNTPQGAFWEAIRLLDFEIATAATGLGRDRLYQMVNPTNGKPTVEAAIALDRALKARGLEPMMILLHARLIDARPADHKTHLQRSKHELELAAAAIGESSPDVALCIEILQDLLKIDEAAVRLRTQVLKCLEREGAQATVLELHERDRRA